MANFFFLLRLPLVSNHYRVHVPFDAFYFGDNTFLSDKLNYAENAFCGLLVSKAF